MSDIECRLSTPARIGSTFEVKTKWLYEEVEGDTPKGEDPAEDKKGSSSFFGAAPCDPLCDPASGTKVLLITQK